MLLLILAIAVVLALMSFAILFVKWLLIIALIVLVISLVNYRKHRSTPTR